MTKNNNTTTKATEPFVQVKLKVLKAWRCIHLPGNVWKIYFVIYRETVGWHEDYAVITREMFEKITGLDRSTITDALQKLEQYNLIQRKHCTKNPKYMINQYVTTWKTPEKVSVKDYAVKTLHSHAVKTLHKQKDPSYYKNLKKRKKGKKPFSFSDLEKSKDKIEVDFFKLFKDYPERTNWKKALEIFRTDVAHPGGIDKIKIALECYLKKKKKTKQYRHSLGGFMENWIDYYDMGKHEAERNNAAEVKQKEADNEAAAELKRIKNLPEISTKAMDKDLKKRAPVVWASIQANKKRRKIGQCKKTPSIKGKAKR